MSRPIWWDHRDHRWCVRGWLVRRRIRRIRLALDARKRPRRLE